MTVTLYHNPRCSKSRETLLLLRARGIEPEIIDYLKNPPTAKELEDLVEKLGLGAEAILRVKEPAFKALGLDPARLSEAAIVKIIEENPALLERPIVVKGARAALGRPPENALAIL
ncbi:MAG: arsenate reductase (glutaredoxin) [Amphiplicatus sp.]